jgi:hypothetical protein
MKLDRSLWNTYPSPRNKNRPGFYVSLGLAFIVFFIVTILAVRLYTMATVIDWLDNLHPALAIWRLLFGLLIIGGWSHWTTLYAHWVKLTAPQQKQLADYRWRMALWLLLVELLLVQTVLADVIGWFVKLTGLQL